MLLRRHGERPVAGFARNGQYRGDEAHIAQRSAVFTDDERLELVQLGLGRFVACEFQRPLEVVDAGPEGTVDVVGRTLKAQRLHPLRFEALAQLTQDAALADAWLARKQHHLAFALARELPAIEQQPNLLLAPY